MPKRVNDQSKKDEPNSPKKKFSQTEANPPMTESALCNNNISEKQFRKMVEVLEETDDTKSFCDAAMALGTSGDMKALPVLIDALQSASKDEIRAVCKALNELRWKNPESSEFREYQDVLVATMEHWQKSTVAYDIKKIIENSLLDSMGIIIDAISTKIDEGETYKERQDAFYSLCEIDDKRIIPILLDISYDSNFGDFCEWDEEEGFTDSGWFDFEDIRKTTYVTLLGFREDGIRGLVQVLLVADNLDKDEIIKVLKENIQEAISILKELYSEAYIHEDLRDTAPDSAFEKESQIHSRLIELGATDQEISEIERGVEEPEEEQEEQEETVDVAYTPDNMDLIASFDAGIDIDDFFDDLTYEEPEEPIDYSEHLKTPDSRAIYDLLCKNRDIKKQVLEKAEFLEQLPDRQAWITINDPQLAKDALKLVLDKIGKRRGTFEKVFKSEMGIKVKELEEAHFTYYADEILDIISHIVRNSKLREDSELSDLLSKIRYGKEGINLRYFRRERSDLSLGDRCGDCTAKGSMNYENSTSWIANPAYNILKISKEKRFIGRINFTLGTFSGRDAIIIDALEFNPQTKEGKPYHEYGIECVQEALRFLKELAVKENRKLIAFTFSNSSGASRMLREQGLPIKTQKTQTSVKLVIPKEDISKCFYFQILGKAVEPEDRESQKSREKLKSLESYVILPAMRDDPEIAEAIRERNFDKASTLILSNNKYFEKIRDGFYYLGTRKEDYQGLLSSKLSEIYKADAVEDHYISREFYVYSPYFVEL
jgi:hypothetical protein